MPLWNGNDRILNLTIVIPIVFNMYACIDWILPGNSDLLFAKILGWNKNRIPAFAGMTV